MIVTMMFTLQFDRPAGETMEEFHKKRENFRRHIELLQMRGTLPRTNILWKYTVCKQPGEQSKILCFPLPVHKAGEVLA